MKVDDWVDIQTEDYKEEVEPPSRVKSIALAIIGMIPQDVKESLVPGAIMAFVGGVPTGVGVAVGYTIFKRSIK